MPQIRNISWLWHIRAIGWVFKYAAGLNTLFIYPTKYINKFVMVVFEADLNRAKPDFIAGAEWGRKERRA